MKSSIQITSAIVSALFTGAMIGAALGVALAPDKGSKTLDKLLKRTKTLVNEKKIKAKTAVSKATAP